MPYQLRTLTSLDQLRAAAPGWNDLWQRADVDIPTLRAEHLLLWLERFAPAARLRLLLVEHEERAVAALPLVGRRLRGVTVGTLPSNDWAAAGELLYDPNHPAEQVMQLLARAVLDQPWPLLVLQPVGYAAPRWEALLAAVESLGSEYRIQHRYEVGTVELPDDWQWGSTWSAKHRRSHLQKLRQLEGMGMVECEHHSEFTPEEVARWMREGFDVEDRSWKGAAGSSVLQSPGIAEFYIEQARQMAAAGRLRLYFLRLEGRAIAFQYGWRAKGTYFSPKIGYDAEFARYSPGKLLTRHVLKACQAEHPRPLYDFHGETTEAVARWTNGGYPIGRVLIPTGRLLGRAMFRLAGSLGDHSTITSAIIR